MATERSSVTRWIARAREPSDAASLLAFRVAFGLLMCFATVRFVAKGWVRELYLEPRFHFSYLGFDWVKPLSAPLMYAHFSLMALAALAFAVGYVPRAAAAAFFLTFTYAELIDKATYLNHYYLVSLLSFVSVFLPWGSARATGSVPRLCYWLLRAQITLVYFYAGMAKVNADWLLHAEPVGTWLRARAHLPVVGPFLELGATAFAMSWCGALYDLGAPLLLSREKTRPYALALAVVFHGAIGFLFPIGVFSLVMLVAITVFFDPSWPRRWSTRFTAYNASKAAGRSVPGPWPELAAAAFVAVQLLAPLRFLLYPGSVNWTEQGFRFSWRVMLVEKAGQVEFQVEAERPHAEYVVQPRRELTPLQYRMMATQPDMIQEYALHLKRRYERRGHQSVRVRADAWVAFNGRPSQRLIEPTADLAGEPRSLLPKPWILPLNE